MITTYLFLLKGTKIKSASQAEFSFLETRLEHLICQPSGAFFLGKKIRTLTDANSSRAPCKPTPTHTYQVIEEQKMHLDATNKKDTIIAHRYAFRIVSRGILFCQKGGLNSYV